MNAVVLRFEARNLLGHDCCGKSEGTESSRLKSSEPAHIIQEAKPGSLVLAKNVWGLLHLLESVDNANCGVCPVWQHGPL